MKLLVFDIEGAGHVNVATREWRELRESTRGVDHAVEAPTAAAERARYAPMG